MDRRLRIGSIMDSLRGSLWFLPTVALVTAVIVAQLLPHADAAYRGPLWFETNAESARSLLSAVATATLTLTGLVFSITMLVLQLTSNQLSPRVMRHFLRDRHNQAVLALLIATFAYALLAVRNVEAQDVPSFTVWLGFLLAMASVAAFIHYIDHMAQSIRASTVVSDVGDETRAAIERLHPETIEEGEAEVPSAAVVLPSGAPDAEVEWKGKPGVLTAVNLDHVAEIAEACGAIIALKPKVGDFVPRGYPVFRVWGFLDDGQDDELRRSVAMRRERTMQQDVGFGLRQLVDIAERALSPGVNDPTTAVQGLDQIHDVLRMLATRRLGPEVRRAEDGRVLAVLERPDWDDLVELAVDEVRVSGMDSLQIHRRLRHLLEDLATVAPPHRRYVLRHQLTLLDEGLTPGFELNRAADRASARGHGG